MDIRTGGKTIMNVLVLGSEGQVGSYLSKHLEENDYNVTRFDISRSAKEDLRAHNNTLLKNAVEDADFVFFLAFDVGGSLYMKKYQDSYDFISNNVKIMDNVFEELKKTETPFIHLSSQMANMIYSTYGVLKCVADRYTRSLGGLNVKLWNVFGVEHDEEKSHVITDFINMAKNKGEIRMRTNGLEERQFLHGQDCSEALEVIMAHYNDLDRSIDIPLTSFEWVTIKQIADIISAEFKHCPVIPAEVEDTIQQNAKNEPEDHVLNLWKPRLSLKDGIKDIIASMA
jgi:nucleoside-diphosphate-sugar epimerase